MKRVLLWLLTMCVTVALADSTQVQGEEEGKRAERRELLKNDFLIHSTPVFENTAKVVPPSPGCRQGKIVVATGSPAKLLHRPLFDDTRKHDSGYYDELRHIDTTSPTAEVTYPTGPTKAVGTDNQLVRLSDGSLLALKDSHIWDAIEQDPPAWINETVTGSVGDQKGMRTGELLFRSTDCGNSWTLYSTIDFGTSLMGNMVSRDHFQMTVG
jgi:hypothetical protein